MLKKIVCLASFPLMAMPFISLEGVAVAGSPYNQRQFSSGFLLKSTNDNSLLLSSLYDQDYHKDKDRDNDRECHRKYQEAYEKIERDRRNISNDDNERDHRRHQHDLERDYRKLQDLRNKYSDCDYGREERNRDYRNDGNYNNYRDYPPGVLPPQR